MKSNRRLAWGLAVFTIITATAWLIISHREKTPLSRTKFMLDTICTVTLYEWDGDGEALLEEAFAIGAHNEYTLSTTVSDSDIARINSSHGQAVEVSSDTARLISDAMIFARQTDGAFDVTIEPVKRLWRFNGGEGTVPSKEALDAAAALTDYRKISLQDRTVTLHDGMGLDLGAIAKGYTADKIAEYLRTKGVTSAVVDLGGNVLVIGSKPDGSDWRIGIREPFGEGNITVVKVSDCSVVTSGIYQRYFEQDGHIYHHILRADNGMPCDTGLYSVTVIGRNSEQCDALSTACMLLGYEKSVELLRQYPDVSAVFVTDQKTLRYSGQLFESTK